MIFIELVIYQNVQASDLASFVAHVRKFFWLLNINFQSVGFLVKQFKTFLVNFSLSFSKMKFNLLLNTGFTVIEIGLLYGGEHLGANICRFLTFLTWSIQDGDFWSVLNRRRRRVKTLQILVEFFECFIKTLNLLPKGHADKL